MAITDKIGVINECLLLTGQNLVSVEEDGSNEWNVCSAAYEGAVGLLLERHDWKFATDIATLTRTGDALDTDYLDAYAKPNGCLHLIWVRTDDYPAEWKIVGNKVLLNADGAAVIAKFVKEPGPDQWPPTFLRVLKTLIQAAIYRGLKRDEKEARSREADAELMLQDARTRTDQEDPKRALFKGTLRNKRRERRA